MIKCGHTPIMGYEKNYCPQFQHYRLCCKICNKYDYCKNPHICNNRVDKCYREIVTS